MVLYTLHSLCVDTKAFKGTDFYVNVMAVRGSGRFLYATGCLHRSFFGLNRLCFLDQVSQVKANTFIRQAYDTPPSNLMIVRHCFLNPIHRVAQTIANQKFELLLLSNTLVYHNAQNFSTTCYLKHINNSAVSITSPILWRVTSLCGKIKFSKIHIKILKKFYFIWSSYQKYWS